MNKQMVVIGIGSNLGDRLLHIQQALGFLERVLTEMRCSCVVETPAHLLPGSPTEWDLPYLNCAVRGLTHLSPHELLDVLKAIERVMDAVKMYRWAPRKIDLDILVYADRVIREDELVIPHKELFSRPFSLFPLGQLWPYWKCPIPESPLFGKTMLELMHASTFDFHRTLLIHPRFIGVLNITPDSFSDGGLFTAPEQAVIHAYELWKSGASFIDVGAILTGSPTALISAEEEWARLQPVLSVLQMLPTSPRISIDTYHEVTALRAIAEFNVEMIHFLGEVSEELASQIESRDKQLVCMHSFSFPPGDDPIASLLTWGENTLERLQRFGVQRKRVILDPGIGFGKTAAQNLLILKQIKALKKLGVAILVGHSRKPFMNVFSSHKKPADRDWQSAALSLHLMDAGVDYLRVHDVRKHMDLLVAHQSLSIGEPICL